MTHASEKVSCNLDFWKLWLLISTYIGVWIIPYDSYRMIFCPVKFENEFRRDGLSIAFNVQTSSLSTQTSIRAWGLEIWNALFRSILKIRLVFDAEDSMN